jgi:hypothetical protein
MRSSIFQVLPKESKPFAIGVIQISTSRTHFGLKANNKPQALVVSHLHH